MATIMLASTAMVGSVTACSGRQAAPSPAASPCRLHMAAGPAQPSHRRTPLTAARRSLSATRHTIVAAAAAAAAPPAAQQKIRIKLSAYQVDLLLESVEMIRNAAAETGAKLSGPVPLPMRKRVYTVLRSPHVNKDSREQFERRTHFRLMDLHELSSQTVDRLMQLDLPAGVDIDVKLL